MFVRGLAMLAGGRCVVLRLFVLAARVMMLSLMVVMRCSVVVTSGGVMMLARRMFCHFSVLPCSDLGRSDIPSSDIPRTNRGIAGQVCAIQASWQWERRFASRTGRLLMRIAVFSRQPVA
jgi:hypothetical protein